MQCFGDAMRPIGRRPRARALVTAAALGLAVVACGPNDPGASEPPLASTAPVDRVSYEDSLATGVNEVPASQMRAAMRARFRLHPDRRFLLAVADAHHTLTGEPLSVVHARRDDGKWVVAYKGREVGTLPDVPTYENGQALVDAWIAQLAKDRKAGTPSNADSTSIIVTQLIADYSPGRLFEALRLIDQRWSDEKTRNPALLAPAARALVGLVMQGVDRAESGDVLSAHALAYVSLARSLSGDRVSDADALLASLMGYREASGKLASSLASNDPVKLLVAENLAGLARVATDSASSRLAKLAYLRAVSNAGRHKDWKNAVAALHVDLRRDAELASTGLLLDDFSLSAGLPYVIERALVERLDPAASGLATTGGARVRLASYPALAPEEDGRLSPATTLPRLDARVRGLAPALRGPALDTSVFASFHRTLLHSAYLSYGLFHLEIRSDFPAAVDFARRFEGLDSTTTDGQLGAWYARLANAYATGADRMTLIDDLARYRALSGAVLERTFDAMNERVRPADPRRARMARLLGERFDTRPSARARYALVARDELLDPVLVARLYGERGASLVHENPRMAVWLAATYRDTAALRAIVNDASAKSWARANALSWLADDVHLSFDEQQREIQEIIAADPREWGLREQYIALLIGQKDYAAAEQVAKDYIRLGRADEPFSLIAAHVSIGNTLIAQERYREAYAVLRPAIETGQGGAMTSGVRALALGGRLAEALELADELVDRYPENAPSRAARMEVWWRQGNSDAIAQELRQHDWIRSDFVVESFIAAYGSDVQAAGRAAFALANAGVPADKLVVLGRAAFDAGRPDLAFELASRGTDPNPMAAMYQTILASHYLAEARGQDIAIDWLRERLPMPLNDDLAFFLVDVGHDELLWAWTADDSRDEGRYTWLMRALVAVRSGLARSPHRQELLAHYAAASTNPYHTMGRFLVGLEREDAMLALATSIHRKAEVSFYLGARARAEGRIADAVDWCRVVVETAQMRDGEYYWAIRELAELSGDPRGLDIPSAIPGVP